jgi:NDP-sugar pyrophosphorylase family protein
MKAMVLAAGLGTRLRPLTDHRPKALVEINGRTLLEIALSRLQSFGVREVIINLHCFADMIVEYLKANDNFGMKIEVSREDTLLDTGGGLKRAGHFFHHDSGQPEQPFILHNVDVLSTIDLAKMLKFHKDHRALATLAVCDRKTSRHLLFDSDLRLCGRKSGTNQPEMVRPCEQPHSLAFSGIHIISPGLLRKLTEDGIFPIITAYLRLAAEEEDILAFRADEYYWRDLGKPEDIVQAAEDLKHKVVVQ